MLALAVYDRLMRRSLFIVLVTAVLFAGCKSSNNTPTGPTANVPFSATDLRVGTSAEATAGRRATVNYLLWLYDSNASQNRGRQFQGGQFAFILGANPRQVIQGFDQGVTGMRVGGQRRIVIPPDLGYGNSPPAGSGIPTNATLLFEVELLDVQ